MLRLFCRAIRCRLSQQALHSTRRPVSCSVTVPAVQRHGRSFPCLRLRVKRMSQKIIPCRHSLFARCLDLLKQQRRSPEKMMKNKTIELNKLKALCAKYLAASVSDAESLITQLSCKIRIGRNYHLQFEPIPEIREFVCFADEIAQSLLDNCSAKLPPALPEI